MARLLVYIEMEHERPSQASLGALTYARALGSERGATVLALVAVPEMSPQGRDALCTELSQYGPDQLMIDSHASTPGPEEHVRTLVRACELLHPAGVLFADSILSAAIAPSLAVKFGVPMTASDGIDHLPVEGPLVLRLLRPPVPRAIATDDAEVVPLTMVREGNESAR